MPDEEKNYNTPCLPRQSSLVEFVDKGTARKDIGQTTLMSNK